MWRLKLVKTGKALRVCELDSGKKPSPDLPRRLYYNFLEIPNLFIRTRGLAPLPGLARRIRSVAREVRKSQAYPFSWSPNAEGVVTSSLIAFSDSILDPCAPGQGPRPSILEDFMLASAPRTLRTKAIPVLCAH